MTLLCDPNQRPFAIIFIPKSISSADFIFSPRYETTSFRSWETLLIFALAVSGIICSLHCMETENCLGFIEIFLEPCTAWRRGARWTNHNLFSDSGYFPPEMLRNPSLNSCLRKEQHRMTCLTFTWLRGLLLGIKVER